MCKKINLFLDETGVDHQANILGLCVVTIEEDNLDLVKKINDKIDIDPESLSNPPIKHWADDNIDARKCVCSYIRKMPISSYMIFSRRNGLKNKIEVIYNKLLSEILNPLILKYSKRYKKNTEFIFNFEQISKKKNKDFSFFKEILDKETEGVSREINIVSKKNSLIYLPDYFLGTFQRCVNKSEASIETWPERMLGQINSKIGLIKFNNLNNEVKRYERGDDINLFLQEVDNNL